MKVIPKIFLTKKEIETLRETSRMVYRIQKEISRNPSSFHELEDMVDNCIQADNSIFIILTCNEVMEYIDY